MRSAIAIRHVPFERLDALAPVPAAQGYAIRYVEAPTDDLGAIGPAEAELLVVLGGPIGACQGGRCPVLAPKLRLRGSIPPAACMRSEQPEPWARLAGHCRRSGLGRDAP